MRVNRTPNINHYPNKNTEEKNIEIKDININKQVKLEIEVGEKFETSILSDKLQAYDLITLQKMENQAENVYAKLENMVGKMLEEQKEAMELLNEEVQVKLQPTLLKLVKESISPNGKLGSEFMSEKLVEFIKTASGQEKAKIDVLVRAIDEVFKEAELVLGSLPEISEQTYQKLIEKLDSFIDTELLKKDPENAKAQLKLMVKEILEDQYKNHEVKTSTSALSLRSQAQELALIEDRERGVAIAETMKKSLDASLQGDEIIDEEMDLEEAIIKAQAIIEKESKLDENIIRGDRQISKELNLLEKAIDEDKEPLIKGFHLENKSLDIETVSKRIVGFVKQASGEDLRQVINFKKEIDEVFKVSQKNLGGLAEVSKRTYDKIMAGIVLIERDLQAKRYPRPSIFAEAMNFYRLFRRDSKIRIRTYVFTLLVWMTIYYSFKYWW